MKKKKKHLKALHFTYVPVNPIIGSTYLFNLVAGGGTHYEPLWLLDELYEVNLIMKLLLTLEWELKSSSN